MATIAHVDAEAENKADQATIAQFIAARDKLVSLREELASEESTLTANNDRYAEAARLHAAGAEADPAAILADSDRRRHRIAGLKTLITEQEENFQALKEPNRVATLHQLDRAAAAHIQQLIVAIIDAEAKADGAQKVLDGALADVRRLRLDLDEARRSQQHQHSVHRPSAAR